MTPIKKKDFLYILAYIDWELVSTGKEKKIKYILIYILCVKCTKNLTERSVITLKLYGSLNDSSG